MRAMGLAVLALVAGAVPASAQGENGKVLPIESKILDIVGLTRGVEGVLKDLGAKVTEKEIVIALSADVLFDFDKADLKPAAIEALMKVVEVLNSVARAPATVEGHTDAKGTDAYNQPLSERRARAVRDWLIKEGGIAPDRLSAQGFGKTRPVAPNTKPDGTDDPDGRQKNRRVEIRVKKA
jgi:photosystem I P700 chlorophyll a apoprotein A2